MYVTVTGHLDELNLPSLYETENLFPQVSMSDRFPAACSPSTRSPLLVPPVDEAVDDIGGVRIDADDVSFVCVSESLPYSLQLHSGVCCLGFTTRNVKVFGLIVSREHCCPATWTWVP